MGAGVWILSALFWLLRRSLLARRQVAYGPTWGCLYVSVFLMVSLLWKL